MKIGIDISQLAYSGTGVATFLENLVEEIVSLDRGNQYILFFSSLRKSLSPKVVSLKQYNNVTIKQFKMPSTFLDFLWNRLHIFSIERFIGPVDIFISSDWTQPPSKAKKATILYDLIVYRYPQETAKKIVAVQKRKLKWVKKEVDTIICISEATKKDAMEILKIEEKRLAIVNPGI